MKNTTKKKQTRLSMKPSASREGRTTVLLSASVDIEVKRQAEANAVAQGFKHSVSAYIQWLIEADTQARKNKAGGSGGMVMHDAIKVDWDAKPRLSPPSQELLDAASKKLAGEQELRIAQRR